MYSSLILYKSNLYGHFHCSPTPSPSGYIQTLNDEGTGSYTMQYGTSGTYEFLCTAVDDMGNEGTGTVVVEVQGRE